MKTKIDQFSANNPNPVLRVGKGGTVLYSNEAGKPLLHEWGVEVGEKLPSYIGDLVQRVISRNRPEKNEVKAGNRVYVVSFHHLPEEECVNIYGFDISDQKKLEERLQESEKKYRNIVETTNEGVWTFNAVSETTYVNEKMAEMLGYNREEMIGRFIWDFADEKDKGIFQVKLANRKRGIDEVYELKLIHGDGSHFWVLISAKAFFDECGKFAGSLGMFTDITERKKMEEALRLSNIYNRSLIEASLDPLVTIGHNGKITDVNGTTEHVTGYSRNKLIGTDFSDYFTEPEKARMGYQQVFTDGEVRDYPLEIQHKDGHLTPVLYNASIYRDENGEVIGVFASARDIAGLKKAEEALKKAHENLEKLVQERTMQLEKAYNSLKESEAGLAEAQRMAHIGSWDWDLPNEKVHWSDELYRIYGCDPHKPGATYDELLNYVHPDDRDNVDNVIKKGLNGEPHAIDYRIILANGEERTVHSQAEVIFDEANIPIRVKGVIQDITENKKTEEKIKTLANAVESSNEAIVTESLECIITSWNKGAEQVYGYSAEEIIGKNASIFEPDNLKGEVKQLIEKIKQGEKIQRYETSRLKEDSTIINVSVTLSPVFDATGELVAISSIARDITERKQAEEALLESEARLRRFYESNMIGVFYYNMDGSITNANDKLLEIVGYTREDLQAGRVNWDKMTPPEYRHMDEHAIAELEVTGVVKPYEKEYTHKDGSRVAIIIGATAFEQTCNEGIAFVLDITERKKADETLANIETARKQEIHHRIKNNLQVISSLLDLQAEMFRDRGCIEYSEVLKAFRESQERVMSIALIHEELHEGRGSDTLNFSPYLKRLVRNLFQTYRLGNVNTRLNIDLEENIFFDMDIAVPLGIIINELVSNSLKYAFLGREKGLIQIKLCREESGECANNIIESEKVGHKSTNFILTVSDNGVGIPENFNSASADSLGLQLVTILVDQLNGELGMKRNKGTEFTIRFKVTEKKNKASSIPQQLI